MQDEVKARLDGLAENITDVLNSTAALKGEKFVNAVCAHFEAAQLMELLSAVGSLIPEERSDMATAIFVGCASSAAGLVSRACADLSDEDCDEAMALADQLVKCKLRTIREIKSELRDASGE